MLNKNMKLLMENFKSFIKEDVGIPSAQPANAGSGIDPQTAQKVDQITKLPYQEFVTQLSAIAGDPKVQAVLKHGLKDGKPADEVVSINKISVPVVKLKPTQNEVDIDKSLAYPLKDPKSFLKYLTATGPVKAGPNAIVTAAGGTLVIDGHHRWSQVYAINKNAVMEAIDINIKGATPETYLKVVQMAIAADLGKLPVANTGPGINLLDNSVTADQIYGYITKKTTPQVAIAAGADGDPLRSAMVRILGGANKALEEQEEPLNNRKQKLIQRGLKTISQLVNSNIASMRRTSQPEAPASPRKFMPQTDDATGWQDKAKGGIVNFIEPAAVNEQKLAARINQLLKEELKKIKR